MDTQVHETLVEIQSTLETLRKMAADIDPALYDEDAGKPTLRQVHRHLLSAEDILGEICAENVEHQEDETNFPFEAWDLVAHRTVTVLGWTEPIASHYRITPGNYARPNTITTAFPAWYLRAQRQLEDAHDWQATQDDVRYGGCP